MACWLIKGKPARNDFDAMLRPGRVDMWITRRPPKAWRRCDWVFFWKTSPHLCVVGAGKFREIHEVNEEGYTTFSVRYLTHPFRETVGIDVLRRDEIVGTASFLKAGVAGTVYPLSDEQAGRIAELLLIANPELQARETKALQNLVVSAPTSGSARVESGLIIRDPYISWILEGMKTWEIRGASTSVRGRIALILGGSASGPTPADDGPRAGDWMSRIPSREAAGF